MNNFCIWGRENHPSMPSDEIEDEGYGKRYWLDEKNWVRPLDKANVPSLSSMIVADERESTRCKRPASPDFVESNTAKVGKYDDGFTFSDIDSDDSWTGCEVKKSVMKVDVPGLQVHISTIQLDASIHKADFRVPKKVRNRQRNRKRKLLVDKTKLMN